MTHGLRTGRRFPVDPRAAWLCLLSLAICTADTAFAQAAQPAPNPAADPASPPVDPSASLDAMPDIGIDWPDMGQPDTVAPLPEDPVAASEPDTPDQPAQQAADAADTGPAEEVVTFTDAGEERKYGVTLRGIDNIGDNQIATRFDSLSVLHQSEGKAANLAQINRRVKEDSDLLDRLLRADGYYAARVRGSVAPPPAGSDKLSVIFDVTPGPLYVLDTVEIAGLAETGPREETLRGAFTMKSGDPINADRILAGQTALATALGENGYPFARVDEPEVRIDHEARNGDLDIIVTPGGYRSFGQILLDNDDVFSARHLQRMARFEPGETYRATDVEDLRRAIVTTGLVSSVTLTPKDAGDGEHVDLDVDLRPAPMRTIAGELGYGTGEGYRAEVSWQHRNLFPPEGSLTLRGVLGTQEQTAQATYRRNNFRERDHVLTGLVSYSNIRRDAYDARTITLSGGLERQTNILFQKHWVWRVGAELIASDEADAFSGGSRRTFFIGAVPLSLTYDGSDDLLNPSKGFRLGGRLSPELSFQGSTFGYAKAQVDASAYQPINDRVVLAGRTRLGTILGSTVDRIAPSRRFYAGGGASVRGYGYQAIGPRYGPDDDPVGGKSLIEFSAEARIRFGNFGVVPFLDAGNISTTFLPRFRDLRVGTGLGVRYYSSFGPIRVDVGTPINPQPGDAKVAVYVSLGQAF